MIAEAHEILELANLGTFMHHAIWCDRNTCVYVLYLQSSCMAESKTILEIQLSFFFG